MGGCFSGPTSSLPREDVGSGSRSSEYRGRLHAEPPSRATTSGIGSPIGRIVSSRYLTDQPSGTSRIRSTTTVEGGPQPAPQLPLHTSGAFFVSPNTAESVLSFLPEPGLPACILVVGGSATGAGDASKPNGARRLVPVWCNTALMETYKISSVAAYSKTLQKLASRDPLLVYVLQKAVNALELQPAGGKGLEMQCNIRQEGSAALWLALPGARLGKTCRAILFQPSFCNMGLRCTTVLTFDGKVLYQNAASLAYLGEFMSFDLGQQVPHNPALPAGGSILSGNSASGVMGPLLHERHARNSLAGLAGRRRSATATAEEAGPGLTADPQGIMLHATPVYTDQEESSPNVLKLLFLFDPEALEEALEGISSTSSSWTGVVQVPNNLKRHLRAVARHQAQNAAALQQLAAAGYVNFGGAASNGDSGSNLPLIMAGIRQGSETSTQHLSPTPPMPAGPSRLRSSALSSAGQAPTPSLPGSQVMTLPIVAPGSPVHHAHPTNPMAAIGRSNYSRLSSGALATSGTYSVGAGAAAEGYNHKTGTSMFLSMLGGGGAGGEIAVLDFHSSQLRQGSEGPHQQQGTSTTAEHQAVLADPYLGALMEGLGSLSGLAPVVEDVEVDLAIESLPDEELPPNPQSPMRQPLGGRGSHDPTSLDGRLHPVLVQALSPHVAHAVSLVSESGVPPRAGSPGLSAAGRDTSTLGPAGHSALLAGVGGAPATHAGYTRKSSSLGQQPQYVPPVLQQQQTHSRSRPSGDCATDKLLAGSMTTLPPMAAMHQQRLQQSTPVFSNSAHLDHSGQQESKQQSSPQHSSASQREGEEEEESSGDGYDEEAVLALAPPVVLPPNRATGAPPARTQTAELPGGAATTSGLDHLSALVSGGQGGPAVELSVNRSFILPRSVASVLNVLERKRAAGAQQQQQQGPPTPGAQPVPGTGLRSRASIGSATLPHVQVPEDQGDGGRQAAGPGVPEQMSRPQLSSIVEHSAIVLLDVPEQGAPVSASHINASASNSLPARGISSRAPGSRTADHVTHQGGPLAPSHTVVTSGAHPNSHIIQEAQPTVGSSTTHSATSRDPSNTAVTSYQALGVANFSFGTQSSDAAGQRRVTGDGTSVTGEHATGTGHVGAPSVLGLKGDATAAARLSATLGMSMTRRASAGGPPPALVDSLPCYHEITVIPLIDPVIDQRVLLITQTDVTNRVDVERKLAALTTAQMSMLEQMFPRHVIEHMLTAPGILSNDVSALAHDHNVVTVLFADVVGFTSMSKDSEAAAVMMFLNELYAEFDDLTLDMDVYQLDTVGDAYIVAGGLVERDEDGFQTVVTARSREQAAQDAMNVFKFAKAMLTRAWSISMPHSGQPVALRVGIHSGRLVSGMLGTRLPKWTLFGDTMNTAARMESTCRPNCIQVSSETRALLAQAERLSGYHSDQLLPSGDWQPHFGRQDAGPLATQRADGQWYATGGVEVKGKGMMDTWVFVLHNQDSQQPQSTSDTGHLHHMQQAAAKTPAPSLPVHADDGGIDLAAGLLPRGNGNGNGMGVRGTVARRPRLTPVPEAHSELSHGRTSTEFTSPPGSGLVQNSSWTSLNGALNKVHEEGSEQEEEEVQVGRGAETAHPGGSTSTRRSHEEPSPSGAAAGSNRPLVLESNGSPSHADTAGAGAGASTGPGSHHQQGSAKRLGSNSSWSAVSVDKDPLSPEGSSWALSVGEGPDSAVQAAGASPEQGGGSGPRKARRPPRKTRSMLTLASLAVATAAAGASVQRPGSGVDSDQTHGEGQAPPQPSGSASELLFKSPPLRQISTGFSGATAGAGEDTGPRAAGSLSSGGPSRRLSHLLSSDPYGQYLGSPEASAGGAGSTLAERASQMSSSRGGARSPAVPASPLSGSARAQTPTSSAAAGAVFSSSRTASGLKVMDGFARLHNVMHSGAASAQARPPVRSVVPSTHHPSIQQPSQPGQEQSSSSRGTLQDLMPGTRQRGVTWLMDPPNPQQQQQQQQQPPPHVTRAASAGYLRNSGTATGGGASQSTRRSGSMTLSRGSNRTSAHRERDRGSGGNSEVLLAVANALQQQQQHAPMSDMLTTGRSSDTETHPNITAAAGFARGSWTEEGTEPGTWGLGPGEDMANPAPALGSRPHSTQHAAAFRLRASNGAASEAPLSPGLIRVSYAHTEVTDTLTAPSAVTSRVASITHQHSMSRPHSIQALETQAAPGRSSSAQLSSAPQQQQQVPRLISYTEAAAGAGATAAPPLAVPAQPPASMQLQVKARPDVASSRTPPGHTSGSFPASRTGVPPRNALQSLGNALILAGASTDTAHAADSEHIPVMQLLVEELEEYRAQHLGQVQGQGDGSQGVRRPASSSGHLVPDTTHLVMRESPRAPQVQAAPPPVLGQGLWSRLAGERGSGQSRDSGGSRPSRSSMDAPGLPGFLAAGSPRHPRASLGMLMHPHGSSQLSRWSSMEMPPAQGQPTQQQQQPYQSHPAPVSPNLQHYSPEHPPTTLRNKRGSGGGGGSSGVLPSVVPHVASRGSRSPSVNSTAPTTSMIHMQLGGNPYPGAMSVDSSSTPRGAGLGLGRAGTGSSGSLQLAAAAAAMSGSNANRAGSDASQAVTGAAGAAGTLSSPRHSIEGGSSNMLPAPAQEGSLDPAGSSDARDPGSNLPRSCHLASTLHSSGRFSPTGAAYALAGTMLNQQQQGQQQHAAPHPQLSAVRTGARNPGSPGGSGGAGPTPVGTGRHRRTSLAVLGSLGAALGSMTAPLDYPQGQGQGQHWDEAAAVAAAQHTRGAMRRRLEAAEGGAGGAASDRLPSLGSSPFMGTPGSYMGAHSHSSWGDELLASGGPGSHMPRRRGDAVPQGPLLMQHPAPPFSASYSRPYTEDRASTRGLLPEGRESPSAPTVIIHGGAVGMRQAAGNAAAHLNTQDGA